MRVKMTVPLILSDDNEASISFEAELTAPILGTKDGKATVEKILNPIIEVI